jgi:hypothetical protein
MVGGRLTGKVHGTNLGLIVIDDRAPGETVAQSDPQYGKHALNAVGRVSQDFGKGSSVGLIYTDQEFGGGWNRIGGLDTTLRLSNSWAADAQWVESSTRARDADGGAYSAGPGAYFDISRQGHSFNLFSNSADYSTGFETNLGFIQTNNVRKNHTHVTYQWYPKKKTIQSWGVEGDEAFAFDHFGNRVYRYLTFDPFWLLPRNTVLAPLIGGNSDTLGPQNGYDLPHNVNFSENWGGLVVKSAPWTQLNFNLVTVRGGNVNYNPAAGQNPALMDQQTVTLLFSLQPLRQLTADNTYLLDRDFAASGGTFVYESQTFRTKLNYQFTRAISARAIVEYDTTLANPAQTSIPRTKQLGTQALLTWLPHPGTAVYIGYNDDLQNLDRSLCNRLPGGMCDPNNTDPPRQLNLLNDGRQVFIKASYLFRF